MKDLRAYNVTELLGAGADVRTVAGRVGHGGGGATTLKHYAAFLATSDRQAVHAVVGPIGRTIKVEAAPPRELAPWEVIARHLADAIKDGTMLPGEDVPTVGDVAQAYGVSVGTAHRAFNQLKMDGLVQLRTCPLRQRG
ncbi:GntR family transcriptional regulator [Streptomyces sp. NPDC050534]|uniref:GntR family transcriptional regulator n=1 Tax=Streptomyces sp. NPDC050534 TaxID=3365625 RepID=UPI0037B7C5E5